jgi:hypothetical protein
MRSRLWTPLDRALLLRAGTTPEGRVVSGHPRDIFPPLVGCYTTIARMNRGAAPLVTALFRLQEIENVKLLWRAANLARAPLAECWRPLEPLASFHFDARTLAPADLVQRLSTTPYRDIARALFRSHAGDQPAVEMGLDRWAWQGLYDEAQRLPASERRTYELLRVLVIEHDLDLLRRGRSFGLDADLVAKATIVLAREHGAAALVDVAAWRPSPSGSTLAATLPARLARLTGEPRGWDDALLAIRRARLRLCRRAFIGWPFQLAPAIALVLLRDAQAGAAMAIAAAQTCPRAEAAAVALALAPTTLES